MFPVIATMEEWYPEGKDTGVYQPVRQNQYIK